MKKTLFILLFLPIVIFSQNLPNTKINMDTIPAIKSVDYNLKTPNIEYMFTSDGYMVGRMVLDGGSEYSLTLEKIKDIIRFSKDSEIYKSLAGLCDVWFLMEKEKGVADEKALTIVLEKLGDKILSLR